MMEDKKDLTKRYYMFTYYNYYPLGAFNDLEATFDDLEEALAYEPEYMYDHRFLWDRITTETIEEWLV